MIIMSTGVTSQLLVGRGLQQLMQGGIINIYGGTRPVSPDEACTATLLATITTNGSLWSDGGGLLMQMTQPNFLENYGIWIINGVSTGTATWFRWSVPTQDNSAFSIVLPRIDGDCGDDLVLPNSVYDITPSYSEELPAFAVGFNQFN